MVEDFETETKTKIETQGVFPGVFITPLKDKKIHSERVTWREWRERWERETSFQGLLNLLHIGLDTDGEDGSDFYETKKWQLLFYVDLARCNPDRDFGEFRKSIIIKAKSVLIRDVFSMIKREADEDRFAWASNKYWARVLLREDVLPQVLAVFKPNRFSDVYEIPYELKEHERKIARDFLFTIASLGWIRHGSYGHHFLGEEQWKLITDTCPEFIKILLDIHRTDYLLENIREVSSEEVEVLRKLIFERTTILGDVPQSIGEILAKDFGQYRSDIAVLLALKARTDHVGKRRAKLNKLFEMRNTLNEAVEDARAEVVQLEKKIIAESLGNEAVRKAAAIRLRAVKETISKLNTENIVIAEKIATFGNV